ncbi:hypothetical protein M758_10G147900 [Ceratodon purpureus]|nr:hypothetical protein M758_10G147900 [Ceratodon purpureus]
MAAPIDLVPPSAILHALLMQLVDGNNSWDAADFGEEGWTPPIACTIEDVEAARGTCKAWKRIIDRSPEYTCVRLAQWEYEQLADHGWNTRKEFVEYQFSVNWAYFGKSWTLHAPMHNRRFRVTPLADLSFAELMELRGMLWDSGNHVMWLAPGEKVAPFIYAWAAEGDRA